MAIRLPGGTNQYLRATASGYSAKPITIAFWFYQPDLTTTFRVLSLGNTGNTEALGRVAILDASDQARFEQVSDAESQDRLALTPGTLTANTWIHLACVITDTDDTAYRNGSAGTPDTATFTAGFPTITDFQIGGYVDSVGTAVSDMRISHPAIYKSALSAGQISALAAGANPVDYGPTDYWPMVSDLNNNQAGRAALVAGNTFPSGTFDYVTGPTINPPAPPAALKKARVVWL